jgi:hypothetical protein
MPRFGYGKKERCKKKPTWGGKSCYFYSMELIGAIVELLFNILAEWIFHKADK